VIHPKTAFESLSKGQISFKDLAKLISQTAGKIKE
jgi:hypothetical protein